MLGTSFQPKVHHDAQEFFTSVITRLLVELSVPCPKDIIMDNLAVDPTEQIVLSYCNKFWVEHLHQNGYSLVENLFTGNVITVLTCEKCNFK